LLLKKISEPKSLSFLHHRQLLAYRLYRLSGSKSSPFTQSTNPHTLLEGVCGTQPSHSGEFGGSHPQYYEPTISEKDLSPLATTPTHRHELSILDFPPHLARAGFVVTFWINFISLLLNLPLQHPDSIPSTKKHRPSVMKGGALI
jgi:hypothetical protein